MKYIRVLLAAAVAAAVLPLSTAVAQPSSRGEEARAEHQRIVDFWTHERVSRAVPRDFVFDLSTGAFVPAKPGGGGGKPDNGGGKPDNGSGGSATTVDGASWNGGGVVDFTTGKVLFAMGSSYYVCSASAIDDPTGNDRSVVLTAAHCVYDEDNREFATNWMFVPDYDSAPAGLTASGSFCADTTYGCWTAAALAVHAGYASAGGFNDQAVLYDYGFAVVGEGGHGDTLLENAASPGTQGFSFAAVATDGSETGWAFGYPAAKKYKGDDLVYCKGPIGTDPYNQDLTYRVGCKMTGGSSGGPWMVGFNESGADVGTGTIVSVNSYGYTGIDAMHGPVLGADTQDVLDAVLAPQTLGSFGSAEIVVGSPPG